MRASSSALVAGKVGLESNAGGAVGDVVGGWFTGAPDIGGGSMAGTGIREQGSGSGQSSAGPNTAVEFNPQKKDHVSL